MKRRALLAALGTGAVGLAGCVGTPDSGSVSLSASTASAALPRATTEFTLRNGSLAEFNSNFYAWRLFKLTETGPVDLSPSIVPQPLHSILPLGSHAWTLSVDNTDLSAAASGGPTTKKVAYLGFGPGEYRFQASGWYDDYENETTATVDFELTGEPIDLVPPRSSSETRDGNTVTVRTRRYEKGRSGVVVTATCAQDGPGESTPIIVEKAYQHAGLRNTLPYFERAGVERVRLLTTDHTSLLPWEFDGDERVEYGGRVYRIETEETGKETMQA